MKIRPTIFQASPGDRHDHPVNWAARAGAANDVEKEVQARLKDRRRRRARMGAGAGLVLAGVVLWQWPWSRATSPMAVPVSTTAIVSLPERQTLSDGSVVDLRRGAQVMPAYTAQQRSVDLVAGEAHFSVARDAQRPFVVKAGGVEFRAVGTAFAVRLGEELVELLVTEGKVSVQSAAPGPATIAEAGKRVRVSTALSTEPSVEAVTSTELSERLAWLAPKLEFSDTPLGEAVQLINLYSAGRENVRITLGHASLAKVGLSGILRADNVETLLSVLESDYGIVVDRKSPREIILRPAK